MDELISVSAACLKKLRHGIYLAGSAQGASADKTRVYFRSTAAVYQLYKEQIDGCRCEEGQPDPEPPPAAPARPLEAISRDMWPLWALIVAKRQKAGESGVGDTFERLAGKWGKRFITAMKKLGADCKCLARRDRWNQLYPYL